MDEEDSFGFSTYFTVSFKATRVLDFQLFPSEWDVKLKINFAEDYDVVKFNLACTKIKFWTGQILTNSIIFSNQNEWATENFANQVDNNLVVTPEPPIDDHLVLVLHSKFEALAAGAFTISEMDIWSDSANGMSFTFKGDSSIHLPDMEDWVGERSYFTKPWWMRDDASTLDTVPSEDADLTIPPEFAYSLDFLMDSLGVPNIEGGKIVRPNFKPTVIDGKKNG